MKDKVIVYIYCFATLFILFLLLFGKRVESPPVTETKNEIIIQMDKSCFDQFQNNMNKTLYLRLNFENGGE